MRRSRILILTLVAFVVSYISHGQPSLTDQQIDSILNQKLEDTTKQKEYETFVGQFTTYKKLFGLFRVRAAKGETYDEYIIYNDKILKHLKVQIIDRSYGDDFQSEEYFYVDNKLVKYQRTVDKRTKGGSYPKDIERIYVDNGRILSTDGKMEGKTLSYLQAQAKRDTEKKWD